MKFHKLLHHVLITTGLALGVIATGTTVNAKAQQLNPNNTENNNPSTNQNVNNNQVHNSGDVLINVPQRNQAASNNFNNNYNYSNNYSNNVNSGSVSSAQNYNYGQAEQYYPSYGQSSSQSHVTFSKANPINSSNYSNSYNPNKSNDTLNHISNTANRIYKDILLNSARNFSNKGYSTDNVIDNKSINSLNKDKATNVTKPNNVKAHTMRLDSAFGKTKQHSVTPTGTIHKHAHHHEWFRDGLSRQNLEARNWVSWHESNHRWRVLSYGGVCVGYFQLSPSYLGYKNGHVNLNKRHQVKVADAYVQGRYGNWVNAQRFWETHHWY